MNAIDISPEACRVRSGRYASALQRYFDAKQRMQDTSDRLAAQLAPPDPHVLVVDDNEGVASGVATILEGEDRFKVTVVTDAETALRIAESAIVGEFVAALIDLHLGHSSITGIDIANALPRGVAVYLTTGETPGDLAVAGERVSAVLTLAKPLDDAAMATLRSSLRERVTPSTVPPRPRRDSEH